MLICPELGSSTGHMRAGPLFEPSKKQDEDSIRSALSYLSKAEQEARVWFEVSSRRTARVREKHEILRSFVTE